MKVSFEGRRERDDDAEQRRGNKYLTTREPTMAIIYGWRIGKKKRFDPCSLNFHGNNAEFNTSRFISIKTLEADQSAIQGVN